MHESIMGFSSEHFYHGRLQADPSVAQHSLAQLPGVAASSLTQAPVQFIDTAGAGFEDELEPEGYSKRNQGEAHLVRQIVNKLLAAGLAASDIAVIAPYSAQVRLLRSMIQQSSGEPKGHELASAMPKENTASSAAIHQSIAAVGLIGRDSHLPDQLPASGIEIDTVDGFQGREKEAIVISLVVSNTKQEIGFLADTRRINVALTRARRKLILVGDSSTLGGNPFYDQLLQYMQRINGYQSIWEWNVV
jgi:superfamily I DNA and/or RNA helicase